MRGKRNIMNAVCEYERGKFDAFTAEDLMIIKDHSEKQENTAAGVLLEAIYCGLRAGYTVGRKRAKREAGRREHGKEKN